MKSSLEKLIHGYQQFQLKYAQGNPSIIAQLADSGQKPEVMVVACSDSRVDPAILFQCDPGDLFVVRNIANIIPPFENDEFHHGTSAALEFGICYLNIKHLVILGHAQCGGIQAKLKQVPLPQNDFIGNWIKQLSTCVKTYGQNVDTYAKQSLVQSYQNCLTFPWIQSRVEAQQLQIHPWFFDMKQGEILQYDFSQQAYLALNTS